MLFLWLTVLRKDWEEAIGKERGGGGVFTVGYAYEGGEFDGGREEPGDYVQHVDQSNVLAEDIDNESSHRRHRQRQRRRF
jgi:hypothetical protein